MLAIVGSLGLEKTQHTNEDLLAEVAALIADKWLIVNGEMAKEHNQFNEHCAYVW